jgi:hypothetical protein
MHHSDSDTESESGSADLATIVTVERRPSNAVLSRPKLVETSLVSEAEDRSYTSNLGTSAPPLVLPRLPPPRPLTLGGRAMGLPTRPKPPLHVKPAR